MWCIKNPLEEVFTGGDPGDGSVGELLYAVGLVEGHHAVRGVVPAGREASLAAILKVFNRVNYRGIPEN